MKKENKTTHLRKAGFANLALGLLVLASCTKTIPYKDADPGEKEQSYSKNLIDPNAEYLYSASMQNASKSSADALPYSSGDNKRVKFVIQENSLQVIETERDERYSANKTNDKLVLDIPIEHVQFECKKDRYGECTNEEANATDIPWDKRSGIKIKLEEAKSGELDLLPLMATTVDSKKGKIDLGLGSELLTPSPVAKKDSSGEDQDGNSPCYSPISTILKSSEITSDSVNFTVQRTFKINEMCMWGIDTLADTTISAVYHYSFVKISSVLTPGFKVVSYPEGSVDERTFGFFSSKRLVLDVDNNKTDVGTVQVMNHWNPNRKVIDYYLSDEFAKPENKMIKDLTYQTVDNINSGLAQAGVSFRINMHDPAGKAPGDIRNSMIVLVEDPVESNIIGYGPQTEDPVTGEIISARTVMFLGTIKKFIRYTYDEILREKRSAAAQAKMALGAKDTAPAIQLSKNLAAQIAAIKGASTQQSSASGIAKINDELAHPAAIKSGTIKSSGGKGTGGLGLAANKLQQAKATLKNYTATKNADYSGNDLKSQLNYMNSAKNCAFAPSSESFAGGISDKLMAKFSDDAKPWTQLSDDEKNAVIAIILPEIWVPTLIHEMGHNLGLRHNFAASEDKANFFSDKELQANNIDHAVPFSSVMDYGNDLKTLPVLGKYDIAALRFGYLRQVDLQQKDGSTTTVSVPSTLDGMQKANPALSLKEYQYCTDEHLGINAGCKQFDLGTSYTEIVQNYIKDYEDNYSSRNFRNGRINMSLIDDLSYASRIGGIFRELRIMMEVRERIKYRYGLADDAKEWTEVEFLKDLDQASKLSGAFLAKVLLVPDATCAIALASKPNEIIAVSPVDSIDKEAMSCFDLQLNPQYIVVAQAGKSFHSKKDPNSTNSYADQIDMRGVWIDKMMAAKYLLNRQIGVFTMDDHTDNFLNIDELREPLQQVILGLMTNNVVDTVPFTLKDGRQAALEINYDVFSTHVIDQPIVPYLSYAFGLPYRAVQFQQKLASKFASQMYDESGAHDEDTDISAALSVSRYSPSSAIAEGSKSVVVSGTKYVADSTNVLAANAMDSMVVSQVLDQIDPKKIAEIHDGVLAKKPVPADASEVEKAAWAMPADTLEAYLNGVIKDTSFYIRLLNILPSAS